jgi:hypothetical protein
MTVPAADTVGQPDRAALVDEAGSVVAIAEKDAKGWQPKVVLREA